MLCKSPIITPNTGRELPVPCGQCLACRINIRRVWTHRMMLEQSTSSASSFLTLTYSDENLPKEFFDEETGQVYADCSVNPAHHKRFINSLRTRWRREFGEKIRFYACGEYGEKTGRPHLHYALFGVPPCYDRSAKVVGGRFVPCNCPTCRTISDIWGNGHIYLGGLNQQSAQYICGYVTKKLTSDRSKRNQDLLQFRHPEFSRSSRNPGLGYDAAVAYGKRIAPFVKTDDDIPPFLVHNGKKWPLGRYLHEKIREQTSLLPYEEGERIEKAKARLYDLFESKAPIGLSRLYVESGLPDVALRLLNAQRVLQLEKRQSQSLLNKQGV